MYFTITPYIKNIDNKNLVILNRLNELIIELASNVNDKNYYSIIIFLQKNKFDSNNIKIDEIINEKDEEKKIKLIDTKDFSSSGYAV